VVLTFRARDNCNVFWNIIARYRTVTERDKPYEELVAPFLEALTAFIAAQANPSATRRDQEIAYERLVATMPQGVREQAETSLVKKEQLRRMVPFFQALALLAQEEDPLGPVASQNEAIDSYQNLVRHCEELWSDAAEMYRLGRFAPAVFLAVVCIEETAKVAVARIQALNWHSRASKLGKHSRELKHHRRKHWLAACSGAVVNARMDRIFGMDRVNEFIRVVEAGQLELVRQRALYSEVIDGRQHLPYRETTADDAKFYVAVAGELLAEASDMADDWQRILDSVSQFEVESEIVGRKGPRP
jgi:AbiV family abortive infection protein